jgi:hypothetical protein
MMAKVNSIVCCALLCFVFEYSIVSADTITFEGVAPAGAQIVPAAPYIEGDFVITSPFPNNGIFSVSHPVNVSGFTSDFLAWNNLDAPPQISLANVFGDPFSVSSLEIGYSNTNPGAGSTDLTIVGNLVGNLVGGGTVSQIFTSVTTATLVNLTGFTNLTSVDFFSSVGDTAIDNITLSAIPEPSSLAALSALFVIGTLTRRRFS